MEPANIELDKQVPMIQKQSGKKSILFWISVAIVLLFVGLLSFLFGRMSVYTANTTSTPATPSPTATVEKPLPTVNISPIIMITGPTITWQPEPTNEFTSTCPPGQYQYGIPLGCVPTTYQCDEKNGGCPICLSGNTTISTPNGAVNVKQITNGDSVWTLDRQGNRVTAQVVEISKRKVDKAHKILHIILKDKRGIFVSAGHPTANGKNVEELHVNELYDRSLIESITYENYDDDYTYDLLPAGDTGYYFANDILMGSTLKK